MDRMIIFTDLDGSLLDAADYSFDAAQEALAAIRQREAALILTSSKTRVEMEALRRRLDNTDPFIVENGAAVLIPPGYFPFPAGRTSTDDSYEAVTLGTPYRRLRTALHEISRDVAGLLQGFGDLPVEDVARLTGLDLPAAQAAKQRDYDEPFVVVGEAIELADLQAAAARRGLQCTKGGRFYHLMGRHDKGSACRILMEAFQTWSREDGRRPVTIGLGDSLNDLPMLAAVDHAILIQKPDGSYDPGVQLPHLIRAVGVGPVGWNRSLMALLARL